MGKQCLTLLTCPVIPCSVPFVSCLTVYLFYCLNSVVILNTSSLIKLMDFIQGFSPGLYSQVTLTTNPDHRDQVPLKDKDFEWATSFWKLLYRKRIWKLLYQKRYAVGVSFFNLSILSMCNLMFCLKHCHL